MIVKMSEREYNDLKEELIYSVSKNGLISTNPMEGKSYLFRTPMDKGFKSYIKIMNVPLVEEFLRLLMVEASGEVMTFIEDSIEVPDEIPSPPPVSEEVLKEEVEEVKVRIVHEFREADFVYGFEDHKGFQSY